MSKQRDDEERNKRLGETFDRDDTADADTTENPPPPPPPTDPGGGDLEGGRNPVKP